MANEAKDEFDEFRDATESVDNSNDEDEKFEDCVQEEENEEKMRREKEEQMTNEEKESLMMEGIELKKLGNDFYLKGENDEAVKKYDEALLRIPLIYEDERSKIYANVGAAYQKMGQKEKAIDKCSKAIQLNPKYVKALARRGNLYEESDKPHEALEDFKKVLEIDPKHIEALCANRRLPDKVKEKDEKLKAEMFDSLKKLGNMVLNPFGLSTDNFNLIQDPSTGGYSVNFNQNKPT